MGKPNERVLVMAEIGIKELVELMAEARNSNDTGQFTRFFDVVDEAAAVVKTLNITFQALQIRK